MIKKIIITVALFVFMTASASFGWWRVSHVPTNVGIIPIEHVFGYLLHGDTFYKDFTK